MAVIVILVLVGRLGGVPICFLKGKKAMAVWGILVPLLAWIGAVRLAKPDSSWAQRFYDSGKTLRAQDRFPDAAELRLRIAELEELLEIERQERQEKTGRQERQEKDERTGPREQPGSRPP